MTSHECRYPCPICLEARAVSLMSAAAQHSAAGRTNAASDTERALHRQLLSAMIGGLADEDARSLARFVTMAPIGERTLELEALEAIADGTEDPAQCAEMVLSEPCRRDTDLEDDDRPTIRRAPTLPQWRVA